MAPDSSVAVREEYADWRDLTICTLGRQSEIAELGRENATCRNGAA
ncbi:hypothetical protein [Blastopirellula marina]|uniref:Uncharacterized protein n=1 Tax=Blastopirellula marina DSM 3645 TaxID=314230 RepID=A4A1S9_9BACT|nr:hypothetical protein [Blastopirellula marina]EAQ77295.1 hypothetical protein DSM3645_29456 [Blastopirellula marina DSM 3645]